MTAQDQLNKHHDLLKLLANEAYEVLCDGKVTFGEIVRLGGLLASKANQFVQLAGLEKRELVLLSVEVALEKILKEKGGLPENYDDQVNYLEFEKNVKAAAAFAKETLPAVLDLAVDVARGKLDLRKPEIQKTCFSLFSLLYRCMFHQKVHVPKKVIPSVKDPKEQKIAEVELVKPELSSDENSLKKEEPQKEKEICPAEPTA